MGKEKVVKKEVGKEKVKQVVTGTCGSCRFYDGSTERQFKRFGIREGLIETRSICRSPTSKAKGHLVKKESSGKVCFVAGTFVAPVTVKEEPKKEKKSKVT
jgi:hypothetical protein